MSTVPRRIDRFLKRSRRFWIFPTGGIAVALVVAPLLRRIDAQTRWPLFDFTPQGATAILTALSAAMFTFVVFVISSLLLVVQLASAQLTPRIIALVFESRYIRRAITVFAFSFAYSVAVSGRISNEVPQLSVTVAVLSCLVSIAVFLYFANRLASDLRPVSLLTMVGRTGIAVIESVYPARFDPDTIEEGPSRPTSARCVKLVTHVGASGTVMAFSPGRIVDAATKAGVVIEMVPQVGDFVARGDPLFRVTAGSTEIDDDELRGYATIGPERTLEQDPRFAFRIIVDIANKALSPAINDPTTAVLAIDQIHRMLIVVGRRRLDEGEIRDASGKVRLAYGTPDWADYVALGISEIRHYGAGSIQVSRRLFAMLTHLIQVLPERRAAPLRREIGLLKEQVKRTFPDAEDRASAEVCDAQGMGGSDPTGAPSDLETTQAPPAV